MRRHICLLAALGGTMLAGAQLSAQDPFKRFEEARSKLPGASGDQSARPTRRPLPVPAADKPSTTASTGAGAIQDQGVHNAVHAAHQSQIVFLRKDLGIGAITEADIVSDFTLGQPMFFRVFTQTSAVNAIAAANGMAASAVYADGVRYKARFTVAGQVFETTMFPWGNPGDHKTWTTWRGQFINTIGAQLTPGTDVFMEMLSKATAIGLLKPGTHTITMEVIPETAIGNDQFIAAGVVASGRFNLTVPANAFTPGNTAICNTKRGATASAALESRALSEARRISSNPDMTILRAVGIGENWDVERNEITGIPTERETTVAILARGAKYCTANVHYFYEDYMGGGTFGTSTASISINPASQRYIPCGCLG
ncbi:hypothetical protein [Erythrobacter sp. BLCC-B19]|uniref:hypothetical protein n=1 Tax=Erythrobacter sp. BLCC-B19 TaxID=3025315 RepID=UPI0023607C07|nr:hypothetical protein [Erythrobacter sp. BLCC-B19]WDA39799.1 hypothetical protein PS060_09490 [Erythrobacter sp. BLCC-B19]